MYGITDKILLWLDWKVLKSTCLVSKQWREAVLVALKALLRKGKPHWIHVICQLNTFNIYNPTSLLIFSG